MEVLCDVQESEGSEISQDVCLLDLPKNNVCMCCVTYRRMRVFEIYTRK